jgi:hypothetical protein
MPAVVYAFLGTLGTLFRSQLSLRVENVALRHQLAIYQRTVKRPSIRVMSKYSAGECGRLAAWVLRLRCSRSCSWLSRAGSIGISWQSSNSSKPRIGC